MPKLRNVTTEKGLPELLLDSWSVCREAIIDLKFPKYTSLTTAFPMVSAAAAAAAAAAAGAVAAAAEDI